MKTIQFKSGVGVPFMVVVVVLVLSCSVHAQPQPQANLTIVKEAADYILSCFFDGGMAATPQQWLLTPYGSHFGCWGLARASVALSNQTYVDACWTWLNWTQEHQDPTTGFITDYTRPSYTSTPQTPWNSTGSMDSTDSYAALFIIALYQTFTADPNYETLSQYIPGLLRSVQAIQATLDNGMTWAKPTYHAKYLMDNTEAAAGFLACAALAPAIGNMTLSEECQSLFELVNSTMITNLWIPASEEFAVALGSPAPNMTIMYSDAIAQMWPIAFGLLPASDPRSVSLATRFFGLQPNWSYPLSQVLLDSGSSAVWGTTGWDFSLAGMAMLQLGNLTGAAQGAQSLWQGAVDSNFGWPWSSGAAGELIVLELGERFNIQPIPPPSTPPSSPPNSPVQPPSSPTSPSTPSQSPTTSPSSSVSPSSPNPSTPPSSGSSSISVTLSLLWIALIALPSIL